MQGGKTTSTAHIAPLHHLLLLHTHPQLLRDAAAIKPLAAELLRP
jgi:hypothetical protein